MILIFFMLQEPGLQLSFEGDARTARTVSLYVPEGTPPTPFLPPGRFRATWEGVITVKLREEYTFSVQGTGTLNLTINGQPVVKSVTLNKGANTLVARYESPASGPAWVRLLWSTREFPPEPIPPTAFSHDPNNAALKTAMQLREGRELVAARRCFKCHDGPKDALPEFSMDAPSLENAGAMFNETWMAAWIASPRSHRADASMPALFADNSSAADIAAYLATLGKADPVKPTAESISAGAKLYATLGCVGCHTLEESKDHRLPLREAKWTTKGLEEFLLHPDKRYAWTRMPDFKLTAEEASQLAAFLISRAAELPAGHGDPERGQALISKSGCLNCHTLNAFNEAPHPDMRDLTKGCLSREPSIDFGFSEEQRSSLRAFLSTDRASLKREAMPEYAQRQIRSLQCAACHRRDGADDVWSTHADEAEALVEKKEEEEEPETKRDQTRPSLTWAGEKLKPEWMAAFLSGEIPYKPRPWLTARMPAFRARAKGVAQGLAMDHGCAPASDPEPKPDPEAAKIGRQLVARANGFACVACHQIGDVKPVGLFEVEGLNFKYARARLRKDYVLRWLRSPIRVEPGSKMPQMADAEGKTPLREILGGDAARQFEAIWQYLLEGEDIHPPD
jgi:mono/diheme cytochrome c family protein